MRFLFQTTRQKPRGAVRFYQLKTESYVVIPVSDYRAIRDAALFCKVEALNKDSPRLTWRHLLDKEGSDRLPDFVTL